MYETEGAGVQRLAGTYLEGVAHEGFIGGGGLAPQDFHAAIALVGEEGMSDALHVGADLVCAPRLQYTFHPCDRPEGLQHAPVCHGGLTHLALGRQHRHALTVTRVAGDIALYPTLLRLEAAPHEGIILTFRAFNEELMAEVCLRLGRLRHNEQPAGVLVNAMHKTHTWVVGIVFGIVTQVPGQRVHEGAGVVSHARVHHQPCRFVDHQQVIVLIDDVERYVLGHDLRFHTRMVQHQRDHIQGLHPVVAFDRTVVDMDATRLCSALDACAAGVAQVFHQELIHAQERLPLVCHHATMLVECAVRRHL